MQIMKLPHNCSAYYMHQVSELDNVKEQTAALIKRDVALGVDTRAGVGKRISAILVTALKRNATLMENFKNAGFKFLGSYRSHNHGNREVAILFRKVSRKEFDTGVAIFSRTRKNVKKRR